MKQVFIYCLYDTRDFKIRYIGKTVNVKKRLAQHLNTSKRGKKSNWISSVINNGFEIRIKVLYKCSEVDWEALECYFISKAVSKGLDLTNATDGGNGASSGEKNPMYGVSLSGELNGMFGKSHTAVSREKMSKNQPRLVGERNGMFGKERPQHLKKIWSDKLKGRKLPPEVRGKISESLRGSKNSFYGKAHSDTSKAKIGEANSKSVLQIDPTTNKIIQTFRSLREAQSSIPKGNVGDCCRGKQKTAGGFAWSYNS